MKIWATWTQKDTISEIGIEYNEDVTRETAIEDLKDIASKLFQGEFDYGVFCPINQQSDLPHSV